MRVIRVAPERFRDEELEPAADIIRQGGLVAFPTETVYGLGADALNERVVRRIFEAKGRPSDNPLIVHVSSIEEVYRIAKPNRVAEKLMEEFFPGPLTLVMEKREAVPEVTTGGLRTVAVRMPKHRVALKLIELSGTPIAAPSANKSGKPSPTRAEHVMEDFESEIECVIDAGRTEVGLESTVVDTTVYPIEILRPGAITREMLEELFEVRVAGKSDVARSPGMKYRHYSPEADTIVIVGEKRREEIKRLAHRLAGEGRTVGVAAMNGEEFESVAPHVYDLGASLEEFAERLFDALRTLDRFCDVIVVEGVEQKGIGLAIMNRLSKAGRVYRV
ncbi:translation factor SUA5 [Geoglobus ahangari]|uniref:Threonylcarbamoyl-AMP synthase n=1 Tax=Geoglobus ahangari TaxID=113653 RepID=A0A0F7IHM0_9EURY|nr:L-threonylcarbamoyladenylate synthase [Geoglobus ahangari]AKG91500.1 translation factor SUA5 [Geoglobus ahangari]